MTRPVFSADTEAFTAPLPPQPGKNTTTGRFSPVGIPLGHEAIALPVVRVFVMVEAFGTLDEVARTLFVEFRFLQHNKIKPPFSFKGK